MRISDWSSDVCSSDLPNLLVLPQRRDSEGGWGYIGGRRFKLADDEALMVTTKDGGADSIGFQVTDPWTLRPETVPRLPSLNKTQAIPHPDGSYTYENGSHPASTPLTNAQLACRLPPHARRPYPALPYTARFRSLPRAAAA